MTISTALPVFCSGALEDEGKRAAVAVRAGAAVFPTLGVTVAVFESAGVTIVWVLGADIDAVPLGRGVQKGVRVGAGVTGGQEPLLSFSAKSSKVINSFRVQSYIYPPNSSSTVIK